MADACLAKVKDPSSLSNIESIITKALAIDLSVDFEKKVLDGSTTILFEAVKDDVTEVVLDVKDLVIQDVSTKDRQPLKFHIDMSGGNVELGHALRIELAKTLKKGERTEIFIRYVTTPQSFAIQWLAPEQTSGKKHPYLFTQCEAVHARSMVPCQDSPMVKATYTASLTVPKELKALMSAECVSEADVGTEYKQYDFVQKVPVPSYLLAIVVGDLRSVDFSPRCRLWTEQEMLDACAYELSDAETYVKTAEDICGPYLWGRYDLVVLPPFFPYGGMENPCLTFCTPTLIAGDKSLVTVVAHEVAHSWTGNLVTNALWGHFWLNEGFTVFLERRIVKKLYGKAQSDFKAVLAMQELQATVDHLGADNPLTQLVMNLDHVHPDDSFSLIPYEKGFAFLMYLEQQLGGDDVFEPYLRAHIEKFAHKSITTDDFVSYLFEFFAGNDKATASLKAIDWDTWLNKPGMPPVMLDFDTSLADAATSLAEKWASATPETAQTLFSANDMAAINAPQTVVLLNTLAQKAPIAHPLLKTMDEIYGLSATSNAEVTLAWQELCLKSAYEEIFPSVVSFVTSQGRMRMTRPLYRAMSKAGPRGKLLAVETFTKHRGLYHNIAAKMIAKDLQLA